MRASRISEELEEMIKHLFFKADARREHMRQEPIGERGLGAQLVHHFVFLDEAERGRTHGRRRGCPPQLPREAALAEKMTGIEHCDHGRLARLRDDG